jgi:serine/threonine protein phosphatase PrpC
VQALVDSGALAPEEAASSQFKNVILQAIGVKPTLVVALNRVSLRRNDRILLCSDGLTGQLTDAEIRGVLARESLDVACDRLVGAANDRGGEDNITVLVADLSGEVLPLAASDGRASLETIQAFHA